MAINANSYGTVSEVAALTRLYLAGETEFSSSTRPTLTDVETWIDRCSGLLNLALANCGFSTPVSQADAKFACDMWVVEKVAALVELSQPTAAFGEEPNPRAAYFQTLGQNATQWVQENELGFKTLGVSVSDASSAALVSTGETVQSSRPDATNTGIEQPFFTRRQFDA